MEPNSMETDRVITTIKQIISETLGLESEYIDMDARFRDDLGADSIDLASIAMLIEDEFDISIESSVATKFENLRDLSAFLEENLENREK